MHGIISTAKLHRPLIKLFFGRENFKLLVDNQKKKFSSLKHITCGWTVTYYLITTTIITVLMLQIQLPTPFIYMSVKFNSIVKDISLVSPTMKSGKILWIWAGEGGFANPKFVNLVGPEIYFLQVNSGVRRQLG